MAYIKQITVGGTAYDIKAAADLSGNIITDTYVNKAGDTMTGGLSGTTITMSGAITGGGDITFGDGTTATLIAKTPGRTAGVLWVGGGKAAAGDANGTVVRLQGGGAVLVGGGEYPSNRYNVGDINDGTEATYIGADGNIYIEPNGQTIANRKTSIFDTSGNLKVTGGSIYTGEKTAWNDGVVGSYIGVDGTIHLANSGTSGLYFHHSKSTSATAGIESRSGSALKVTSQATVGAAIRNIYAGTDAPSGGLDGEVYIRYI